MTLICLISGQLEPNLYSVILLKPDHLVLIHTQATKVNAKKLKDYVTSKKYVAKHTALIETDAFDFNQIRVTASLLSKRLLKDRDNKQIVLNITGGTKPMILEFFQAFDAQGCKHIYIDTQNETCWWRESDKTKAEDFRINLTVLELLLAKNASITDYATSELIARLSPLTRFLWDIRKKKDKDVKMNKWLQAFSKGGIRPQDIPPLHHAQLNVRKKAVVIDEKSDTEIHVRLGDTIFEEKQGRFWASWLIGGWFEYRVYEIMKETGGYDDIQCNVRIGISQKSEKLYKNEIDIIAIKNGIPVFVECKSGKVDIKHITNLKAVGDMYGGRYGELVLVVSEPVKSKTLREKIRDYGIELYEGYEEIEKKLPTLHEWMVVKK